MIQGICDINFFCVIARHRLDKRNAFVPTCSFVPAHI